MDNPTLMQQVVEMSRRQVLGRGLTVAGWGAFAGVLGLGTVETVSFFFPRVLFRPPSTFRIGTPEAFLSSEGDPDAHGVIFVDDRWKSKQRFFVVREKERIYAISARCVHLGCTINWFQDLRTFKCPCHGSEYYGNGVNFAGPAPRPLDRLGIDINPDGLLVVDTSIVLSPDRFDTAGAFVSL